jgi:hypothetical protein
MKKGEKERRRKRGKSEREEEEEARYVPQPLMRSVMRKTCKY